MRNWESYVISLPRAVERREVLLPRLSSLGVRPIVFDAIEGERLTEADLDRVYDADRNRVAFKRPLALPEIGCYLSHHAVWSTIARSTSPGAFVFEDDAEPTDDLPAVMAGIAEFDLGDHLIKLDSYTPRRGRHVASLSGTHKLLDPWIAPAKSQGYAISRGAAALLCASALPIRRPIDLDIKHWWESGVTVLVVSPSPLVAPADTSRGSDIESLRRQIRLDRSMPQRLTRNLVYQARYLVAASVARLQRRSSDRTEIRRLA